MTFEQYVAYEKECSPGDAEAWLRLVESVRRLLEAHPWALKRDAESRAYDLNANSVRQAEPHSPDFWRGQAEMQMDAPGVWLEAMVAERDDLRAAWNKLQGEPEQENDTTEDDIDGFAE